MLIIALIFLVVVLIDDVVSNHRISLKEDVEYRYFQLVQTASWYPSDDNAHLYVAFKDVYERFELAVQRAHKWYCDVSIWENEAEKVHNRFMKHFVR